MKKIKLSVMLCFIGASLFAQEEWGQKFEQLGTDLPTPNTYRAGSGAPGENYWQQRADYQIDVEINDETQVLTGSETIIYYNNSPNPLEYLWVQLDQNVRAKNNLSDITSNTSIQDSLPAKFFEGRMGANEYEGGYNIKAVKANGKELPHTINRTMMRIDLEQPLKTGETFTFSIDWSYNIYDRMVIGGRGGFEYFPEDGNYAYTCAQWFPRMAVYDDYEGWQNKQFIGRGEFALTFGNYEVNITVPSDHIVASTGMLQNAKKVLSKDQYNRFEKAKTTFENPVFIVTEEEAIANESSKSTKTSTWEFKAENVRDFAFASSRKYIWDAQAVKLEDGSTPLAMSFYPKEGNPLWADESTRAVKNTLEVYSERTFDYPYPVAISVHAANQGMEYPMICFNYGRPAPDGTVSDRLKDGMIGVIVHEVGHNYFPMIVNSDERQWTWMDEGLNSFLERETKRERYAEECDLTWGSPQGITRYMKMEKSQIRPIMTNSEQVKQFGYNAYGKPSAALTVLRETVMGPELFDASFKEYANRWKFKHPKPADFFRTMEDASAVDLDWFWRGWFYSVDHVDISLEEVKWFKMRNEETDVENKGKKIKEGDLSASADEVTGFDAGPEPFSLIETDDRFYGEFMNRVDDKAIMQKFADKNFYQLKFANQGGLVMPLIVEFTFEDSSKVTEQIPAEIWRYNEQEITKVFSFEKEVTNIVVDPENNTADTDTEDNVFPRKMEASKFDNFKKDKNAKVDVSGAWNYEADTPQGKTSGVLTINKKKNKYSGKLVSNNGETPLQSVSVDGNVLTFTFKVDAGGGINIKSEVIVVDEAFSGDMVIGSFGSYPITGAKQ